MNLLSVVSFAGIFAVAFSASLMPAPLSDAELDLINTMADTWKAVKYFGEEEMNRVKCLLGTFLDESPFYKKPPFPQFFYPEVELPKSFDSRDHWPHCSTMKIINDQSNCGSCWAFGSVEAMSDRICVASNNNVILSVEDVMSCCTQCGNGCNGGYPSMAWQYYRTIGVVTGGPYDSDQGCLPYEVPPCHTHTPNCTVTHETPKCEGHCRSGYSKSYKQDKHYGISSYRIQGVENIMRDIYKNGPVTAAFIVYSDFPQYKSGVYKHTTGKKLGGHAVKIIGWGVEDGQDYWLVANSWTTKWGDQGYFKIAKGKNECELEDNIFAGLPRSTF